ncbi:uncharacterized protein LOC123201111 [Mangifera indica]|uniref:uncharacterized protein LOC123201111 n=1 Tax=Mangifera indica TaxID=29780 RepID=UPI001CFAEFDD|nr:uncharacterized protein LOC123201111 [Mangifera indica]
MSIASSKQSFPTNALSPTPKPRTKTLCTSVANSNQMITKILPGCPSGWWICFGYGVPYYGGCGCSPFSFFALGPSIVVGIGGGFDLLVIFMFIGSGAAVVRRFFGSKGNDEY